MGLRHLGRVMLCFEDNNNDFFLFTADSRLWKSKLITYKAAPTSVVIKAKKTLVENTVLALHAMLLRKK